jgi:predicted TPR repeat methyltransferase
VQRWTASRRECSVGEARPEIQASDQNSQGIPKNGLPFFFAQVLEAEPRNVKALLRRAAAREAQGNTQGAAADFNQALQHEPANKEAQAGVERLKGAAAAPSSQ